MNICSLSQKTSSIKLVFSNNLLSKFVKFYNQMEHAEALFDLFSVHHLGRSLWKMFGKDRSVHQLEVPPLPPLEDD